MNKKQQNFELDTPAIIIDTEEEFKDINEANDKDRNYKRPRFKPTIDDNEERSHS
jgi:hypothetical protein